MSDTAIRVENLSKLYHIGKAQQRHDTLRDALVAGLRAPLKRLLSFVPRPSLHGDEPFDWAQDRPFDQAQDRRRTLRPGSGHATDPSTGLRTGDETIWALKDVSFEVQRGEVVGIPSLRSGQASAAMGRGRRRC